jgi:hypothetical protein
MDLEGLATFRRKFLEATELDAMRRYSLVAPDPDGPMSWWAEAELRALELA